MPLPSRVSDLVTPKDDGVKSSLQVDSAAPLNPSITSIPSTVSLSASSCSGQHSRPNNQSATKTNSSSTIPRHFNTTIPGNHDTCSENRYTRRPSSSSPSPSLTSSHHFSTVLLSPTEPRPTLTRRQPASRSSHGIETLNGPPPALSTQRSYTTESSRRQHLPVELIVSRPQLRPRSKTELNIESAARLTKILTDNHLFVEPFDTKLLEEDSRKKGKMAVRLGQNSKQPYVDDDDDDDDDQDETLRNLEGIQLSTEKHDSRSLRDDESKPTSEDLFLNLAISDSSKDEIEEGPRKIDRRRSGVNVLNSRHPHSSLSSVSMRPSSGKNVPRHSVSSSQGSTSFRWSPSAQLQDFSPASFGSSPSKGPLYAATAHPLNQDSRSLVNSNIHLNALRARSGSNRETSESPFAHDQRRSVREPSPEPLTRTYKQSSLSYSASGRYTSSPFTRLPDTSADSRRRPQIHHAEDTVSTVSTTAPSTIWDDVEDLKHRMRKIELTGKLPSTSTAAISKACGDRPPTASTTMTTISSSPKHERVGSISPETSTVKGPETTQIHPLLHAALARSKPLIGRDIYNALEATALDALTLAAMSGSVAGLENLPDSTPASRVNRQLRRKADSVCRSITELCIAITEELETKPRENRSPQPKRERSISLHQSIEAAQEPGYLRAASQDPGIRPNSQILTRLEARRASMQALDSSQGQHGLSQDAVTPAASTTPLANRLDRASSEDPEVRSSSRLLNRLEARRASIQMSASGHSRYRSPQGNDSPTVSASPSVNRLDRSSPGRQGRSGEEDTPNNSAKPVPRPVTEIAQSRPSFPSRVPHEYTSQYPLPNPSRHSPSAQPSLLTRRNRFSLSSQTSPSTPKILPGNARYLDRITPPSSADSAKLAEMRQQRMASLRGDILERRARGTEVGVSP